jgi:hypothetical protein
MRKDKVDVVRRTLLKTMGGAVLASAFPDVLRVSAAQRSPQEQRPRARIAVFWEAGFPEINGCGITSFPMYQALAAFDVTYLSEAELIARLNAESFDLLITPYGSAFPKRAWPTLLRYFRGGGNWLNLGGSPVTTPVIREGTEWRVENQQATYHKRLGITQSFPVKGSEIASYESAGAFGKSDALVSDLKATEVYELYVRFSSTSDTPDESGSDGPREAVLYPLAFGLNQQQHRVAAPLIQIDRLQGDFAGGRWVLANFSGSISEAAIRALAKRAAQGVIQFLVHSDFACYREDELPSFTVTVQRPLGNLEKIVRGGCRLAVRNSAHQLVSLLTVELAACGGERTGDCRLMTGAGAISATKKLAPGCYNVEARLSLNPTTDGADYELTYLTGFWIYDDALLTHRKRLTVDSHSFYREGEVYPVTGTTYMASDVHRKFLFEPNPFIWAKDFREMKAAGINMVRTGIWTGWKKYMPEVGKVNEVALRALDAFLLTAHQHDIPVIFNFFAFLPETWGGENAYLDPRSVQAQQQFIATFAQRYAHVDDLMWDLINEPSFCSPKYLWSCRPNYDDHEKAAWQKWLQERYPFPSEEERATHLQQLWRTTSDDALELPRLEDFDSVNIHNARQPLKTLDYRLFAQDMFARWVRAMTEAIRSNGNKQQLITVGQDEGGTGDSPSPQFFGAAVDFTSLHNWWNNDELVWDSVVMKARAKASLVEETGAMFYEQMDGGAWRTEEQVRNLVERKLAISFGANGAGFIEWIWNANCYMDSDNEAAIGFHRVDQTMKPELEPFLAISKFMAKHGPRLRSRQDDPVLMVIPHSQMFAPRSFAMEATRKCVRVMNYQCRTSLGAVSEYMLDQSDTKAKLIVVPAPRVLTQKCWEALLASADRGATVVISGCLDTDEHWLRVERGKDFGWVAETKPVSESEFIEIANRRYHVRYDGDKIQRLEKAVVNGEATTRVLVQAHGAGRIVWSPLPLETGASLDPLVAFYRFALTRAAVSSGFRVFPDDPSVLVLPALFADVALYTLVSESDRDTLLRLLHLETKTAFSLTVRAGRTALVLIDRKTGKVIDATAPTAIGPKPVHRATSREPRNYRTEEQ